MAKFYVESGTMETVIDADDARGAALWAVHRCLEQVLPICPDDPLSPQQKSERMLERGCYVLGESIRTSEQGFGRGDADVHDTAGLFVEWNQLMTAMSNLEQQLRVVG